MRLTRRKVMVAGLGAGLLSSRLSLVFAADAIDVPPQPYFANIGRVVDALRILGERMSAGDEEEIRRLAENAETADVLRAEEILNRYTLLRVRLGKDGSGRTTLGQARRQLVEQGWRSFLVRVENPFSLKATIDFPSLLYGVGNEMGVIVPEGTLAGGGGYGVTIDGPQTRQLASRYLKTWMGYQFYANGGMHRVLSGIGVEYQILQIFSRDRGRRSALIALHSADAPQVTTGASLAYAASVSAAAMMSAGVAVRPEFDCLPSRLVSLDIKDWDDTGCMASVLVRDEVGRLYPAPVHRLAPDFDFQPQVYRSDGETLRLPAGSYTVETWRGPEYIRNSQSLTVRDSTEEPLLKVRLKRWINAAALGWYPGETHIHAAGCSHYVVPTEGVTPETIIRHVRGEALAVGDVLTWGAGYDYQKHFFSGRVYEPKNILELPELQEANNTALKPRSAPHDSMVRYDLEISGFPSSHSGHLVLLGLKDQRYPGTEKIEDWPSWNLPVLQWARSQGAVAGYAHCGFGLAVNSHELPNFEIPPFSAVGANECIVDIVHGAVDFMSGGEIDPVAELNCWYHLLNCGFRVSMVGETDFPCIFDERVGVGRSYVGLAHAPVGDVGYAAWIEGIRRGRVYFGDGRSHFIDYRINGCELGDSGVQLPGPGKLKLSVRIAAYLDEVRIGERIFPPWHLEHARIGNSRDVWVEVVMNGEAVARKAITADGELRELSFEHELERSAWLSLRILPSGHTCPIFVKIADKPIRASKRSARWCLTCIDALWNEKSSLIASSELRAAAQAYDYARSFYRKVLTECNRE